MISWVNDWNNENLLQFNTSWLAFLRTWYYFRLCFSFSCSGYDLTLIKKSHTLNYYSFLQKLLLKKLANLLLVTVIAQYTAKTTDSEKVFYFSSLMSCSMIKLKPHIFFNCKNFIFSDFTWKKNLLYGPLYILFCCCYYAHYAMIMTKNKLFFPSNTAFTTQLSWR